MSKLNLQYLLILFVIAKEMEKQIAKLKAFK